MIKINQTIPLGSLIINFLTFNMSTSNLNVVLHFLPWKSVHREGFGSAGQFVGGYPMVEGLQVDDGM